MTTTFQRADDATEQLLKRAMDEWHRILKVCGVTVDILMVEDIDDEGQSSSALKHDGYPALATIKATSPKDRALGMADVLLTIDAVRWSSMADGQRLAVLDHELEHLMVRGDRPRDLVTLDPKTMQPVVPIKRDDRGRPLLKMRLHDWQLGGFRAVAERHKETAIEVQAIRRCRDDGQYWWDFGLKAVPKVSKAAAE